MNIFLFFALGILFGGAIFFLAFFVASRMFPVLLPSEEGELSDLDEEEISPWRKLLNFCKCTFKKIHYRHYIGIGAILLSFLATLFLYEVSTARAVDTVMDIVDSMKVYFVTILDGDLTTLPRMSGMPDVDLSAILPFDVVELARRLEALPGAIFDSFNFRMYAYLSGKTLTNFLLFGVPVFALVAIGFSLFFSWLTKPHDKKEDEPRPAETKALSRYKQLTEKPFSLIRSWCKATFEFFKKHPAYVIIFSLLWFYNLNVFSILGEFLAYYFYFVATFDIASFFFYLLRLFIDLVIMFSGAPLVFWLVVGWIGLCLFREHLGYKKLEKHEKENEQFVEGLPVVTLAVGWMGKGKTEQITDMGISAAIMFRRNALKDMLEIDSRFPCFNFSALIQDLRQAVEAKEIDNLLPAELWIEARRAAFEKEPSPDKIWGYDYTRYPMDFNDDLKIENIWDALRDYAKLFFIYFVQSSIIFANYSIREDFTFEDYGYLIDWDHDIFRRDARKQAAESRYCKILDEDMLRIGTKMVQDNEFVGALQFGVIDDTEIGKGRGNQITTKDVKKTDTECNELNDGFEDFLKVIRHLATIRYRCYAIVLADEQRASSWKADGREVALVAKIKTVSELKLALPFFTFACAAYDFFRPRYDDFITEYEIARPDMCLPTYLIKSVCTFFFARHQRTINRFGYKEKLLMLGSGAEGEEDESFEHIYYISKKKVHSERYSTDCLKGIFRRRMENCTKGFSEIPSFSGLDATPEELESMHSHFIKRINNLLGK